MSSSLIPIFEAKQEGTIFKHFNAKTEYSVNRDSISDVKWSITGIARDLL